MTAPSDPPQAQETRLLHLGSHPPDQCGFVNPPIYRGSTALYGTVRTMDESVHDPVKKTTPTYGRFGTPTSRAFESAMAELEHGHDSVTTNSGLSAITTTLLALVEAGDHILVTDSVYWPTRDFCNSLKRMGVETEYYDPRIGSAVTTLFRKNTRLICLESPGSLTFEVQDLPAITAACRAHGVVSIVDNTWATPIFLKPLDLGADISVHAATKYITGHSDSFLGVIVCNEKTYPAVRGAALRIGQCGGPEDVYLGLRGLRTLSVRLQQHQRQALLLAEWLQHCEEVKEVIHPALPEHPDHAIWKRDFTGSTGLFSFTLDPRFTRSGVNAMVDGMKLFGLGHSWGGYESLILPSDPTSFRRPGSWVNRGPLVRLHVGLENLEDLKNDLRAGFQRLKTSS